VSKGTFFPPTLSTECVCFFTLYLKGGNLVLGWEMLKFMGGVCPGAENHPLSIP
jgi:hypothetical protein